MTIKFTKATKRSSWLRLCIAGPSGSGKTYTALRFARALASSIDKVFGLDSERGTMTKYVPIFGEFQHADLDTHAPLVYVDGIESAEAAGAEVVVVDSLSHAWSGRDGALEQVDNAARRSKSQNTFFAWRDVTPQHNRLVDALIGVRSHLITTLRTKTDYVIETVNGKQVPRKIGMAPIQRDGMEYEFDVFGEMDLDHNLIITKSRCPALADRVFAKPGEEVVEILKDWLRGDGEPVARKRPGVEEHARADQQAVTEQEMEGLRAELGLSVDAASLAQVPWRRGVARHEQLVAERAKQLMRASASKAELDAFSPVASSLPDAHRAELRDVYAAVLRDLRGREAPAGGEGAAS